MTTPAPIPAAAVEPTPNLDRLGHRAIARACDAYFKAAGGVFYSDHGLTVALESIASDSAALPRLASPAVESALFQREIEQLHERLATAETERDALAERLRVVSEALKICERNCHAAVKESRDDRSRLLHILSDTADICRLATAESKESAS